MSAKLKHLLGNEAVGWLAGRLHDAHAAFDRDGFTVRCLAGLEALELKTRAHHIASAMAMYLPASFPEAAAIIVRSLEPEIEATGNTGLSVLRYMPHDRFIEIRGLDHPSAAYAMQEEVTKRFSCEFSIRAFLVRHPEATLERMQGWAVHENAHLRRLASEGLRPRLPWAARVPALVSDPSPVLAVLELLKDDPERYVQRSVANNINDIAKDHPDLAVELCRRWLVDAPPARQWIIGHAMRHQVKRGNKRALALFGHHQSPRIEITDVKLKPKAVQMGGVLEFSFSLVSTARKTQDLAVDYAVHFVKANGGLRPKVFKIGKLALEPGAKASMGGKVSFADMTTRKHYPGHHQLALQINGQPFEIATFAVRR